LSDLYFFKDDDLIHKAKIKPWKKPAEPRPQDAFSQVYSNVDCEELEDRELPALVGTGMVFDVECFKNFFMVAFRSVINGKVVVLAQTNTEQLNASKLQWMLNNFCLIGFFSKVYDIPMLQLAAKGATCATLFAASCDIIKRDLKPYAFEKKYRLNQHKFNHIDLIEVAPLRGSLKLYSGRMHTKRMQDLPFDPMKSLAPSEMEEIAVYCLNDLVSTELLFKELEAPLALRIQMSRQYGVDLRSKSDAQIAEAVISSELAKESGTRPKRPEIPPGDSYHYKVPSFITFRTPVLQEMLELVRNARFVVNDEGYVEMPEAIDNLQLAIGNCVYKMGIGGLHSTEKTVAYKADKDTLLIDRDVVSYYPQIILNQQLYPQHLGRSFLVVYQSIVTRRVKAKNAGDKSTADTLKIVVNGSFGKLGSKYSVLYAPDLMIQVTVTGQLALLMEIEMIEALGIPVVSANTDGVVIQCPQERYSELLERIAWWEQLTGFTTEESRYKAIYSRDVNNYIAHKEDGKCKVKGTYGERGSAGNSVLSKNPENLICNDAALALIEKGTPVEETIRGSKDIRRFVTIRNVTGGARKSEVYLGKTIRWYYSTEMKGEINRAVTGAKVPNTDCARPLMELPAEFPSDVDYDRYIASAMEILYDIGHTERPAKVFYLGPLFA